MDVDERLVRPAGRDERVAAGRRLAEAGTDDEQQVGVAHACRELRVGADADVAGVDPRGVVDVVLPAEPGTDGELVRLREGEEVRRGLLRPPAAADDRERPLRAGEQLAQARQLVRSRVGLQRRVRLCVVRLDLLREHVLRQREHDRSRVARTWRS